jgi:P-type E1-E2 ATPase
MIEINIPGYSKPLQLEHLILDYNGTLAEDGKLIDMVDSLLIELSQQIKIHVVTADTFGTVQEQLKKTPCEIKILSESNQAQQKADYLKSFGEQKTVCIGNGANDQKMLKNAILGIAVIQEEGAAVNTLNAADIVCRSIIDALTLLCRPKRLKATMRV